MANTLDAAIPKILAGGLSVLRKRTVMPSLIRRDFDDEAAQRGDTIDVWDRETPDVRDVSPANTPPTTGDTTLAKTQITLDNWKEAPFYMTDKDILEVVENGVIPDQVSKAAKKLAEQVNSDIFATYYRVYESVGTAGSAPFSADFSDATAARKVLNQNEADMDPRRMVVSPEAEENAINLSEFADTGFSNDDQVITEADIGRKLGFDWVYDQQVPSHTVGSLSGTTVDGAHTAGIQQDTVTLATTGSISLNQGDIITFSNHTQNYAVEADLGSAGDVQIEPSLQQDLSGGEDVSLAVSTNHTVNLAFHQDAFALAVRPIADADLEDVAVTRTMQDPVTGIPLRVEVTREHKRTQWSFDILYGANSIDPRQAVRVLGA